VRQAGLPRQSLALTPGPAPRSGAALDLAARTVSIRRQYVETNGSLLIAPPKSRAGVRTVAFPATLVPELREHLETYAGPDNTALVFTGQRGGVLRRGNFRKASGWSAAVAAIGAAGTTFS